MCAAGGSGRLEDACLRTPRALSSKKMSPVCRWRQWEGGRCTPEDPEGALQQEDEPCVPLAAVGGQKMHA